MPHISLAFEPLQFNFHYVLRVTRREETGPCDAINSAALYFDFWLMISVKLSRSCRQPLIPFPAKSPPKTSFLAHRPIYPGLPRYPKAFPPLYSHHIARNTRARREISQQLVCQTLPGSACCYNIWFAIWLWFNFPFVRWNQEFCVLEIPRLCSRLFIETYN